MQKSRCHPSSLPSIAKHMLYFLSASNLSSRREMVQRKAAKVMILKKLQRSSFFCERALAALNHEKGSGDNSALLPSLLGSALLAYLVFSDFFLVMQNFNLTGKKCFVNK